MTEAARAGAPKLCRGQAPGMARAAGRDSAGEAGAVARSKGVRGRRGKEGMKSADPCLAWLGFNASFVTAGLAG